MKFSESLKVSILVILFFFLCLFVYTKLFGPIFIANISNDSNLFTVNGTGSASAVPTTATVTVGITKTANSIQVAQQQVNSIANQLTADFVNLGVNKTDIKTTNYSANPVQTGGVMYPMQSNSNGGVASNLAFPVRPPITDGVYQVSEDLIVKTNNTALANKVVDTATKDGANVIGGVQFTFSDNEQTQLEDQARTKAIADAKSTAEKIAQESGLHLGKLVNVSENGGPQPVVFNSMAKTAAPSSSTDLQAGKNQVTVNVTLSYQTW